MFLTPSERDRLVRTIERVTAWPLFILSVVMVPILIVSAISPHAVGLREADWLIWSIFAFEYLLRLSISPDRDTFVSRHLFDLLIVVLPFLEPLRFVRVVRVTRAVAFVGEAVHEEEIAQAVGQSWWQRQRRKFNDRLKAIILRKPVPRVIRWILVVLLVLMPIFVLHYESKVPIPAGSQIHTVGDAYWWATSTLSTVGYGDRVPTTPEGRGIGYFFMFVGTAFFVTATGLVAQRLIRTISMGHETPPSTASVADELALIRERLEAIEGRLPPAPPP